MGCLDCKNYKIKKIYIYLIQYTIFYDKKIFSHSKLCTDNSMQKVLVKEGSNSDHITRLVNTNAKFIDDICYIYNN